MNARCMIGYFNEARIPITSPNEYITSLREKINEIMLKEFDHTNLLYFIQIQFDQNRLQDYINKYKDSINPSIFAKALIENCKTINPSIYDFLLSNLYSDEYALAYLIHHFRSGTLEKAKSKVSSPRSLEHCKIKETYKQDFAKICELFPN